MADRAKPKMSPITIPIDIRFNFSASFIWTVMRFKRVRIGGAGEHIRSVFIMPKTTIAKTWSLTSYDPRDLMMADDSVAKLASVLKERYGHIAAKKDYLWPGCPALQVLDCVLSLNRRYYAFVEPRVKRIAAQHPKVTTLSHLRQLMHRYATPLEFSDHELDYKDEQRTNILRAVLGYLLRVQAESPGTTEPERLRRWTTTVTPADAGPLRIKGFALSGFQYLRMLFGAQTAKPDRHLIRFVSEVTGDGSMTWKRLIVSNALRPLPACR